MSSDYQGQDPLEIAAQAERDLNSQQAKGNVTERKTGASDTVLESGIDASAASKFPGASVTIGGQGQGDNRTIPEEEGGSVLGTGKVTRARDFEGAGGPEDKARLAAEERPGDDDVSGNVRQGGETMRPPGQVSNAAQGGAGGRQE